MNEPQCPEKKNLTDYATGKLPEEAAASIEQHLESCPQCEVTIEKLEAESNTLVEGLRAAAEVDPASEVTDYKRVFEHLANLPSGASTSSGDSARSLPVVETQPTHLGPYELSTKLGEGGMGAVYKARHEHLGKIVAIKILPQKSVGDAETVARFRREMKAVGQLHHPNIVTAFDAGEANGTHFLVMEYVEGSDLANLVKQHGPLPIEKATSYLAQAARGLAFAHSKGIVHRDIKPANLLVDGEGVVKVLDMGLARLEGDAATLAANDGLTQSGQVMGTIDYMAPEQAFDTRHVDAKADVYSLGCTLYRCLTGQNLYSGDTIMQKFLAHREQPIPSLSAARQEIPKALERIYQRMVAKKPEDRPTMAEVAAELEKLIQLSASAPAIVELAKRTSSASGKKKPPIKIMLAAAAGFLFVALGVWIIIRDKGGKEITRIEAPDGASVEVKSPGTTVEKPASTKPSLPPNSHPPAASPSATSAFDSLRRENIDPYELSVAGDGDAAHAPAQLVGIYGDSRLAMGVGILGMAMFPNDQAIATLASDSYYTFLTVWDRESGRRKISKVLPSLGRDVAVSPDGTLLACVGQNMLKIWEYPLMREYRNLEGQGTNLIQCFRISPDNRWGAGTDASGTLYIWDLKANQLVHREPGQKTAQSSLAFHPASSLLAVVIDGTLGNDIGLWELPSCKPLPKQTGHTKSATDVAFSPDGKSLYSVGRDRALLRWDWVTGTSQTLVKANLGPGFDALAVHPEGHTLATVDHAGEIVLWEAASGVKKRSFSTKYAIPGGKTSRTHLQFAKSGRFLVSSNPMLTTVGVWPLTEREPVLAEGHREALQELVVTPNGRQLVTNSTAGEARVWNVATRQVERSFATAIPDPLPKSMALSPDGATLVVGSKGYLRLWKLSDGSDVQSIELGANGRPIRSVQFSGDGRYLGSRHQFVTISDLNTGATRKLPLEGSSSEGWAMSADGQTAYVKKDGREISSFRTGDWSLDKDWPREKIGNEGVPTLSADGELIALSTLSRSEAIEARSGKPVVGLPGATSITAGPVGQRFAGVRLNKYWVWDRASGLQEFNFPENVILGHPTFSPDGRHLLTSNLNGTVYVLRLSNSPLPYSGEGSGVRGNSVVTGPPSPQPSPIKGEEAKVDDAWLKQVAALPPVKQLDVVAKKLQELNPGFDGKLTDAEGRGLPKVERGMVTELTLFSDSVTDISPLRAFAGLKVLNCRAKSGIKGKLADLSPLQGLPLTSLDIGHNEQLLDLSPLTGMPLTNLNCHWTQVSDLSPLRGMPLTKLNCGASRISDLSPLAGMKLTELTCSELKCANLSLAPLKGMPLTLLYLHYTPVNDLSPLKGMPLTVLNCGATGVTDLSPLRGAPLLELSIGGTKIADLSPLMEMPLTKLVCNATKVTELSPLLNIPLKDLNCEFVPTRDEPILRSIKTLEKINGKPAVEFWKEVGAGGTPGTTPPAAKTTRDDSVIQQWRKATVALPPVKQLDAVAKKLHELNPGFDGRLTGADGNGPPKIENGMVTEVAFASDNVADISPIRAFSGLKVLACKGRTNQAGKIVDLSPLQELGLSTLEIANNKIEDLGPLTGMPLTTLDVFQNPKILDLSPLKGMPLVNLNFGSTKVSDLSPLKGMPLANLHFRATNVIDLSPLRGMPLAELNLTETKVADISPLREMPLTSLTCVATKVRDWSPLKGLRLTKLDASGSPSLNDLSMLRGMPLTSLTLNQTQVSDLSPLEGMKLTNLGLSGTRISDLTPLRGMPLIYLGFSGAPVSDLSPVFGMRLDVLYCAGTKVTDLSPLRGMPLGVFTIDSSPVSDLSPVRGIVSSHSMNCSNTKVSDLSQFEDWKNLTKLNVKGILVTAEQVAKLQQALPKCKIEWDDTVKPAANP